MTDLDAIRADLSSIRKRIECLPTTWTMLIIVLMTSVVVGTLAIAVVSELEPFKSIGAQ